MKYIREEFENKCKNCEIKDWNLDVIKKSDMCHKCYIEHLESLIESMQDKKDNANKSI